MERIAIPTIKAFSDAVARWEAMSDSERADARAEVEAEQAIESQWRAAARVEARRVRLLALSGVHDRFAGATPEQLSWDPAMLDAVRSSHRVWLHGPIGLGKTHAASALVMHAIRTKNIAARMITGVALLDRVRASYDAAGVTKDGQSDIIGHLTESPVLALDDLGKERWTPWAAERFYALINARYERDLPLIITSNLAPTELAAQWGARGMDESYGSALVRRMIEMAGTIYEMNGETK